MDKVKKYQDLKIWQQGVEIACEVYGLSAQLPEDEKYGLKSQINRAAVSIPSNMRKAVQEAVIKTTNDF